MKYANELLLPANNRRLMEFSQRLDRVVIRLGGSFDECRSVDFNNKIGFSDAEYRSVNFRYEKEEEAAIFSLSTSHLIPIDASWDHVVAKSLLNDEYMGLNEYDEDDIRSVLFSDEEIDERDVDEEDGEYVEGYLEHETKMIVIRLGRSVLASKIVLFNITNDEFEEINTHVGVHRSINTAAAEGEIRDLKKLLDTGETMFDVSFHESDLSLPTPADLIIFTNTFVECGLLGRGTKAFRGAPA